jgi:large subunit ribosomal protein L29
MTMKIQAMLDWSPEEKAAKAKEWAQSLFTLRLQKATGQLENPMKIKELRKDIARLKTAQHMGAAETAAAAAHEVAAHAEGTEEKISASAKNAAGSAKPKAHAVASGKGAKKRAAAHKKTAAAATGKKTGGSSAKAHVPSKKSSAASGKAAGAPKAKSAATKKSKKK